MAYYDPHGPPGPYEPARTQEEYPSDRIYSSPTSAYPPSYPPQHTSEQVQMPQPRLPSPPYPTATSPTSAYSHIGHDSIAAAMHSTINPGGQTFLSPDLISQVTATVIQQLKAYGLDSSQQQQQQPQQQQQQTPPPPPSQPPLPQNLPPQQQNIPNLPPPQQQYPPPPPPQSTQQAQQAQPQQQMPYMAQSAPPPPLSSDATYYKSYNQPTETRAPAACSISSDPRESQPKASSEKRPGGGMERNNAPASSENMTTLEKIWGKMFIEGQPTPRLGQLLRGIAVHLIENYPPGNTLVVVPDKMQKYYADTKVPTDTYPWQDIFDDRTSSISRIYRDIEAEHHLVQNPQNLKERPDTPGLTPQGFERWYTLMIQANPDREFARLQKTVLDMPINNPDDRKERFPKELPRRLFPSTADKKILEKLEVSIITHCEVELPQFPPEDRSKSPPQQRNRPRDLTPSRTQPGTTERKTAGGSATASKSSSQERETTAVALDDDEDTTATTRPIERERKPYSAQPGGGKKYEDGGASNLKSSDMNSNKAASGTTTMRADQSYGRGPSITSGTAGHSHAHHGSISSTKHGRGRRSSSVGMKTNGAGGDYRHSEPDLNLGSYDTAGYANLTSAGTTGSHLYKSGGGSGATVGAGATGVGIGSGGALDLYGEEDHMLDTDRLGYRDYERDDPRDYENLLERERERERDRDRDRDRRSGAGRNTWSDEEYYRGSTGVGSGLLGGQGGGPDYEYKYR